MVRNYGDRFLDKQGYVRIKTKAPAHQYVPEHRAIMEEIIGRELREGETVHHLNGVRHDNRPENLELWVRAQPYGQRARDLPACIHCGNHPYHSDPDFDWLK